MLIRLSTEMDYPSDDFSYLSSSFGGQLATDEYGYFSSLSSDYSNYPFTVPTLPQYPTTSAHLIADGQTLGVAEDPTQTRTTAVTPAESSIAAGGPETSADKVESSKPKLEGMPTAVKAGITVSVLVAVLALLGVAFICLGRLEKTKGRQNIKQKRYTKWWSYLRDSSPESKILTDARLHEPYRFKGGHVSRWENQSLPNPKPEIFATISVAPPEDDAVRHAQPPDSQHPTCSSQPLISLFTGSTTSDSTERITITSTLPPSYAAFTGVSSLDVSPTTPTNSHSNHFSDSGTVSPIGRGSPTNNNGAW